MFLQSYKIMRCHHSLDNSDKDCIFWKRLAHVCLRGVTKHILFFVDISLPLDYGCLLEIYYVEKIFSFHSAADLQELIQEYCELLKSSLLLSNVCWIILQYLTDCIRLKLNCRESMAGISNMLFWIVAPTQHRHMKLIA